MIIFIFFLYGVLIGSFLNVCIYRIPLSQNIATTPSHCMNCNQKIKYYDLIPIISYILLKGRCRHCNCKVSFRYPTIELLNGIFYALIYSVYGFTAISIILCLFVSTLLILTCIDLDHMLVPDILNIFILILAFFAVFFGYRPMFEHILGAFVISVPLLVIAYFTNGFGLGDVFLYFTAGLLVGYKLAVFSFFVACIIGAIFGIYLIKTKKNQKKSEIPFVPYIAAGLIISILYGDSIWNWYFSFLFVNLI